jgi:signal transduction histidine kinase
VLVNLLANAIKFARGMGSDLRAESTLRTGSVFTLALPRA